MKNTVIFILLLFVLSGTALITARGMHSSATLEGIFSDEVSSVNFHWAYLKTRKDDRLLDSCLVYRNRFRFSVALPERKTDCRITFSGMSIAPEVTLTRRQTTQLTISANFYGEPTHYNPYELWMKARQAVEWFEAQHATPPDWLIRHRDSLARLIYND